MYVCWENKFSNQLVAPNPLNDEKEKSIERGGFCTLKGVNKWPIHPVKVGRRS